MTRRNHCRFVAASAAIVAAALPTLGAHAKSATTEYSPKSLNITGAVGLQLNPTAQLPDADEVRVQGNYYGLGEVKNEGFDEELDVKSVY